MTDCVVFVVDYSTVGDHSHTEHSTVPIAVAVVATRPPGQTIEDVQFCAFDS